MSAPDAKPVTDLWRQAFQHVETLETRAPEMRALLLSDMENDNPELARKVKLLLGEITQEQATLTRVVEQSRSVAPSKFEEGVTIGAYTLIRSIGQGGMADVWLARRTDGEIKRPVAIKLPMAVLPKSILTERFKRERDILSQLDHPHIAKLFDAGTTVNGQPFMVLEFIDGQSLTPYCNEKKLSIDARVKLMIDASRAVHHAHSRLVLHRDIKPSNMLVTQEGSLKVLDFGIAKLLAEDRTAEETQFTQMTGAAMTPKYAAPEQLVAATVTTSTDVYALAVVLYELLTGEFPYATTNAIDVSERLKLLNAPCRSLADASIDDAQRTTLGNPSIRSVQRAFKGDLSFILAKALRPAAQDRYDSALAFADDLEKYLRNQPVTARQGARWYRFRKFVARHRVPLAIGATGAMAAAALGINTVLQTQRAAQSQARADSIDSLMESLFQGMSPDVAKSRTFTAKELLDRASAAMRAKDAEAFDTGSPNQARMAKLYADISEFSDAEKLYVNVRESAAKSGNRHLEFETLIQLADIASKRNDAKRGRDAITSAASLGAQLFKSPSRELARLDVFRAQQSFTEGDDAKALAEYDRAAQHLKQFQPPDVVHLAWALEGAGIAARELRDLETAKARFTEASELDEMYPVRGETERLSLRSNLADSRLSLGDAQGAFALHKRICSQYSERLGQGNEFTRLACRRAVLAGVRTNYLVETREIVRQLQSNLPVNDESERVRVAWYEGLIKLYEGHPEQAVAAMRAQLAQVEKNTSGPSTYGAHLRRYVAECLLRQGKISEALAELSTIETQLVGLLGANHPDLAAVHVLKAYALARNGELATARAMIASSRKTLVEKYGGDAAFSVAAQIYDFMLNPPNMSESTSQKNIALLRKRAANTFGIQPALAKIDLLLSQARPPYAFDEVPLVF